MTTTDVSIPSSASVDDTSIELDGSGKISIKDDGIGAAMLKSGSVTQVKLENPVDEKNETSGVASTTFSGLSGGVFLLVYEGDVTNDTTLYIEINGISNANYQVQALDHTDTSAAATSYFNTAYFTLLDTIAATSAIRGKALLFVNEDDDRVNMESNGMARSNYGLIGHGWNPTDEVTSITAIKIGVVAGTMTGNFKLYKLDT